MSMPGLTLQNRITTLMILSSVIFISVFTFIQINNQIAVINRYNTYKAGITSSIVNNNLEAILKHSGKTDLNQNIQASIKDLKETGIVNDATVFTPDGEIIASTKDELIGETIDLRDSNRVQGLTGEKWLVPIIDKSHQMINMYLALHSNPESSQMTYAAKLTFPLGDMEESLAAVYQPVIFSAIIIIIANFIFGFAISKTVVGPIKLLNKVTKLIAAGDLDVRTRINTKDELQELGQTFNNMTEELVKMKARAENANPLTKLPGNIAIQEQIEKMIQENTKFLVIYCDLDNFKAFNDKYGIAKGDEAIIITAEVLKEAVKTRGDTQDFLGHEGGDDFIILTTPDKSQKVADYIITEFDRKIRTLYSAEDLTQGYIISTARDNTIQKFSIMTISLAGVSNESRPILSYAEITNIAAEVKKRAKAIDKSVFVLDKRTA